MLTVQTTQCQTRGPIHATPSLVCRSKLPQSRTKRVSEGLLIKTCLLGLQMSFLLPFQIGIECYGTMTCRTIITSLGTSGVRVPRGGM